MARRKSDSEEVCVFTGDAQSAVSAPPPAVCFPNLPEKQPEHRTIALATLKHHRALSVLTPPARSEKCHLAGHMTGSVRHMQSMLTVNDV